MRTSNYVYIFHMFCACQPMILPIKFEAHVLCVLTKVCDFSKTGNSEVKRMIYIRVILDVNDN